MYEVGQQKVGGSSPRMRGALRCKRFRWSFWGIIPADAGSTGKAATKTTGTGDHPRGCGEHALKDTVSFACSGSSPRMRGARDAARLTEQAARIIPADAGSTPRWAARSRPCTDHPRGCGEHSFKAPICRFSSGSSPRMRGAHRAHSRNNRCPGIIPADAGSTPDRTRPGGGRQDHPRGCGEHYDLPEHFAGHAGSSPRMRGARKSRPPTRTPTRIIPADAGSTIRTSHDL